MSCVLSHGGRWWIGILMIGAVCWGGTNGWAQSATPLQEFERARNAFNYSDYDKAARLFQALLYPVDRLGTKYLRIEAHKYLGISLFFLSEKARVELSQLKDPAKKLALKQRYKALRKRSAFEFDRQISLDRDAVLDSLENPPYVVNFFNQVRREFFKRQKAINNTRQRRQQVVVKVFRTQIERRIHRVPFLVAFLPFGISQFYNGHTAKGALLLTTETAMLLTNMICYALLVSLQNNQNSAQPGTFPSDVLATAKGLQYAQFASLGVFGGLLVYGFIDGLYYHLKYKITHRETLVPLVPKVDLGQFSMPR